MAVRPTSFSLIETVDAVWMLRPDVDGRAGMLEVEPNSAPPVCRLGRASFGVSHH